MFTYFLCRMFFSGHIAGFSWKLQSTLLVHNSRSWVFKTWWRLKLSKKSSEPVLQKKGEIRSVGKLKSPPRKHCCRVSSTHQYIEISTQTNSPAAVSHSRVWHARMIQCLTLLKFSGTIPIPVYLGWKYIEICSNEVVSYDLCRVRFPTKHMLRQWSKLEKPFWGYHHHSSATGSVASLPLKENTHIYIYMYIYTYILKNLGWFLRMTQIAWKNMNRQGKKDDTLALKTDCLRETSV